MIIFIIIWRVFLGIPSLRWSSHPWEGSSCGGSCWHWHPRQETLCRPCRCLTVIKWIPKQGFSCAIWIWSPPVLHYCGFQRGRLSDQPVYKKVSHFSQKHSLCHQTFADIFPFKWCCSYLGVRTVGAVLWGMIRTTWSVSDHYHCHCDRRKTRLNVTLLYTFFLTWHPAGTESKSCRVEGVLPRKVSGAKKSRTSPLEAMVLR